MKRIVSIILLSTLLCTMMAVCVSSATPYSVLRTCPLCNTKTLEVYCGNYLRTADEDVTCAVYSHTKPCVVMNRVFYSSLGYCLNESCLYGPTYGGVYPYTEHVETCQHSSTDDVIYNTCLYS